MTATTSPPPDRTVFETAVPSALVASAVVATPLEEAHSDRLMSGGLQMYRQPIVDLQSGRLNRVEALARLHLSDGTVVYPDEFLPPLSIGELDELFRIGLDQALASLARWDRLDLDVTVSVNVAPETLLHADCIAWVSQALERNGIEPQRLELELLETQEMDRADTREIVDTLLALGVGLAMDDLGNGYSSLKRLSALPFRSIKLDRELLADIRLRPVETLSMIATLRQLGRDLDVKVVVERLEDQGMTEAVAVLGVTLGQGYYLARPMPADAVPDWIADYHHPLQPGSVVTNLGALAYHWQFSRSESPHLRDLDECPLTAFLARELESGSSDGADLQDWHRHQHGTDTDAQLAASRHVVTWLVARVLAESDAVTAQW